MIPILDASEWGLSLEISLTLLIPDFQTGDLHDS